MHGTSHHIGLDTHDVGSWTKPIEQNMVFTVEPGIYIPKEGLGIRIEDDVLVTSGEPDVLTSTCPKTIEDIESITGTPF